MQAPKEDGSPNSHDDRKTPLEKEKSTTSSTSPTGTSENARPLPQGPVELNSNLPVRVEKKVNPVQGSVEKEKPPTGGSKSKPKEKSKGRDKTKGAKGGATQASPKGHSKDSDSEEGGSSSDSPSSSSSAASKPPLRQRCYHTKPGDQHCVCGLPGRDEFQTVRHLLGLGVAAGDKDEMRSFWENRIATISVPCEDDLVAAAQFGLVGEVDPVAANPHWMGAASRLKARIEMARRVAEKVARCVEERPLRS